MFSLLVGLNDGVVPFGRMLEYTDGSLRTSFLSDLSALQAVPALAMPEVGDDRHEQLAHVGNTLNIRSDGREHRFKFVRDARFDPIALSDVEVIMSDLAISAWELRRTHWSVKSVDLFESLLAHHLRSGPTPSLHDRFGPSVVVPFPTTSARDPKLVAVMMPFDAAFDVVYETIQEAANDAGLHCVRADSIWEQPHVMGDVASLLWRAQVVVADLTGRNTNVFYETGLAHGLPRATVLLTQNSEDVPFDLRSVRYLRYGLGTHDRRSLRKKLAERLTALASSA